MNKKDNIIKTIPKHIAVIMDGNGRWAKERGLPRIEGHRAGAKALKRTITAAKEIGIKILTVYAFSTENWKRPAVEVEALMSLLAEQLQKEFTELKNNNIKVDFIGNIDILKDSTRALIEKTKESTSCNNGMLLNVALNYGGRDEIVKAAKRIAEDFKDGKLTIEEINEQKMSEYLYTGNQDYPDLLIRLSGETRISNFLLWQIAYSEIYFCPILWPDFNKEHLLEIINDYQKKERRFGGLKSLNK